MCRRDIVTKHEDALRHGNKILCIRTLGTQAIFDSLITKLVGHTSSVRSVAYSPDGMRIISGSDDQTIRIWDAHSGKLENILEGHTSSVLSIAYSPDGIRIISGSKDRTIRLWDAISGMLECTLKGHTDDVSSVAYSPDGMTVISGS